MDGLAAGDIQSEGSGKKSPNLKVSPTCPPAYSVAEYGSMTPKAEDKNPRRRTRMNFLSTHAPKAGSLVRLSTEDVLEGGFSRNYLSDKCIKPPPRLRHASTPWTKCYVVVDKADKTKFRMYEQESKTFLLSAKLEEGLACFFISQYPDFPDLPSEEITNESHVGDPWFCCILRQQKNGDGENVPAYSLISRSCRNCDQRLSKYSCENLSCNTKWAGGTLGTAAVVASSSMPPSAGSGALAGLRTTGNCAITAAKSATEAASAMLGFSSPKLVPSRLQRRSGSGSFGSFDDFDNDSDLFAGKFGDARQLRQRLAVIVHELKYISCGKDGSGNIEKAAARRIAICLPSLARDGDDNFHHEHKTAAPNSSASKKKHEKNQEEAQKKKKEKKKKKKAPPEDSSTCSSTETSDASSSSSSSSGSSSGDDDDEDDDALSRGDLMPVGWCSRQKRTPANTMKLSNRLPVWNTRLKSLCLKFEGGRVLSSSKKNFLAKCCTAEGANGKGGGKLLKSDLIGHTCIQFGKVRFRRFNLDYKSPVSPVQAFACALSMFRWLGGEDNC